MGPGLLLAPMGLRFLMQAVTYGRCTNHSCINALIMYMHIYIYTCK